MTKRALSLLFLLFFLSYLPASVTTINLYVATTGSDSTGSGTITLPYLTIAKAMTRVPSLMVGQSFTINVAAGTFAEPIDYRGHVSTGQEVLGVVGAGIGSTTITGTLTCDGDTMAVCAYGNAVNALVSALTVNVSTNAAAACGGCFRLAIDNVTFTGTYAGGDAAVKSYNGGYIAFLDAVTINGINTAANSLGFDAFNGGRGGLENAGTLTITGPGGSSNGAVCFVEESGAHFQMNINAAANGNITISGCSQGILLSSQSSFDSFTSTGTVSVTNSVTPSGSAGITVNGGSAFNMNPTGMTVSNFTTCLVGNGLSVLDQGPGNRSLSNCGITPGPSTVCGASGVCNFTQGSQAVLF